MYTPLKSKYLLYLMKKHEIEDYYGEYFLK